MTVENFVRIVWTVFEKIEKKSKNDCFLAIFGLILAMFLTSQPYDFDATALTIVEIFSTKFRVFLSFIRRRYKKRL